MKERAGSLATVRFVRRARLAEKLKEVYDLEDIKEVWAGSSMLLTRVFMKLRTINPRNALLASPFCS